ncbi:MAG: ferrochelatase [Gemmatimonadaceae bacterium]
MTTAVPHLLLVNLGTPTAPTPEAVRTFLDEFLSDPDVVDLPWILWQPILQGIVLRTRPKRVAHQYASIWTTAGSPLRVATEQMVAALRARSGGRYTVSEAYRYGEPSLDSAMQQLARMSSGPVVLVPLFPQRTGATTGTAFQRGREAAARSGIADRLVERPIAPAAPGYIAAMVARWHEALAGAATAPEHLVVSFHGIPTRYNRRENLVYTEDCEETTAAFIEAIGWPADRMTLAYQSKFGPEPWLLPATADVLVELPRRGITNVAVITPGFVTEGLETIEEIGIRGREDFEAAGGRHYLRVGGVEDHVGFLDTLEELALA